MPDQYHTNSPYPKSLEGLQAFRLFGHRKWRLVKKGSALPGHKSLFFHSRRWVSPVISNQLHHPGRVLHKGSPCSIYKYVGIAKTERGGDLMLNYLKGGVVARRRRQCRANPMTISDLTNDWEALERERRIPRFCSCCHEEEFWCPICANSDGKWVCSCTHPRQARDMVEAPFVNPNLIMGQPVKWRSSSFGELSGIYLGLAGPRQLRVRHPFTKQEAVISSAFLVG
jgi:hypothetical protein